MKKRLTKKQVFMSISAFLVICLVCTGNIVMATSSVHPVSEAAISNNQDAQNYRRWSSPVKSYLIPNEDGTLTRIEYIRKYNSKTDIQEKIVKENYDKNFNLLSSNEIPMELELFGGFFAGKNYNFFVFGQENPKESEKVECFRIVKYTKSWERIGAVGLYDCNTTVPFDAGSLRMTESGDMLYIRTSHEMYRSSDGLNHQANVTIAVKQSTMQIIDSAYDVSNITTGYVSHSFNQFIQVDNNKIITLDHGDAYPRSIVLAQYETEAGREDAGTILNRARYKDILKIRGEIGENETDASVGGLEAGVSTYLAAGNSLPQETDMPIRMPRNIFVSVTDKENFPNGETKLIWVTNYQTDSKKEISTPHLVKTGEDSFLLMWEEIELAENKKYNYRVCYAAIDGKGTIKEIHSINARLSDCKPVVYNDQAVWYVTDGSKMTFYSLPTDGSSVESDRDSIPQDTLEELADQIQVLHAGRENPVNRILYLGGTTGAVRYLRVTLPEELKKAVEDGTLDYQVKYEASNTNVSVSESGELRPKALGKAIVTTKVTIGQVTRTFQTSVSVRNPSITFIKGRKSLKVGSKMMFEVKLAGYAPKDITWGTLKKNKAYVSKNQGKTKAVVSAVSSGKDTLVIKVNGEVKRTVVLNIQ